MSPKEQEALFIRVRKRFKDRPKRWCSGYVHGIMDEDQYVKAPAVYYRTQSIYNEGYLWGFLDARGEDALAWAWARKLSPTGKAVSFQWWRKK